LYGLTGFGVRDADVLVPTGFQPFKLKYKGDDRADAMSYAMTSLTKQLERETDAAIRALHRRGYERMSGFGDWLPASGDAYAVCSRENAPAVERAPEVTIAGVKVIGDPCAPADKFYIVANGTVKGYPVPKAPPDPLDALIDGVALRRLLEMDERKRREHIVGAIITPAQRAALSVHWSAQLRAKVAASAEADRRAAVSVYVEVDE
jgi:hypothetical protein